MLPMIDHFDTDAVNLESDYRFTAFYELKYIYIYLLFIVRGHPVIGQSTRWLFSILWFISLQIGL